MYVRAGMFLSVCVNGLGFGLVGSPECTFIFLSHKSFENDSQTRK